MSAFSKNESASLNSLSSSARKPRSTNASSAEEFLLKSSLLSLFTDFETASKSDGRNVILAILYAWYFAILFGNWLASIFLNTGISTFSSPFSIASAKRDHSFLTHTPIKYSGLVPSTIITFEEIIAE